MNKTKLINFLESLNINNNPDDYKYLVDIGIKYAFNYLDEEEKLFVSSIIRKYPDIYYHQYFKYIYDIDITKKVNIDDINIKNLLFEYYKYFNHKYVGPFFYIDNKIYEHKVDISTCNINDNYINDKMSHFDFFNTLKIDDDYGHYPRGRVLYIVNNNEFIIYVDSVLIKNNKVINIIKEKYNLNENNVSIKLDEHYTHDNF